MLTSTSKKILITGGAGFIGSHLYNFLRREFPSQEVIIVDLFSPRGDGNINLLEDPKHIFTKCVDIDLSHTSISTEPLKDCEIIFHLAAQVSHPMSMQSPMLDLQSNQMTTLKLLASLDQIKKLDPKNFKPPHIIFTSTRQLYGEAQYLPVDELHPISFKDNNAIHKFASESYLKLYSELGICRASILRLTNTFGPNMDLNAKHKGFVPIFIQQALEKKCIELWGDGEQKRDFNYVDDVISALVACSKNKDLSTSYEIYNLGGERSYTLLEFLDQLNQLIPLRYELLPWPKDRKNIDIGNYEGSFEKIKLKLNWQPNIPLHLGLQKTIDSILNMKK